MKFLFFIVLGERYILLFIFSKVNRQMVKKIIVILIKYL